MDENLQFHKSQLKLFCRICGVPRAVNNDREPVLVNIYVDEIMDIWNVNILEDDVDIHPTNICRACILKIKR